MRCPRDKTSLETHRYEGDVNADVCPTCGGMWLAEGELELIEETRERDYADELARMPDLGYNAYEVALHKGDAMLACPSCEGEMERREYARCSQILIDVCPSCHGVWLDRGEIEALEVFFERSRFEARDIRRLFLKTLRAFF